MVTFFDDNNNNDENKNNENEVEIEKMKQTPEDFQLEFNSGFTDSLKKQYQVLGDTIDFIDKTAQKVDAVYHKVKQFDDKFDKFNEKMDKFEEKLDNHVFLSPAQCSEMSDLVRSISIKIADSLNSIGYYPDAKDFGDIVKRVKISIRAMIKAKFSAQRWYMIRFIDYDNAMVYLEGFGVEDFLRYRSRKVKAYRFN
ncbi:ORF6C domain-containing protein [Paenibacillus sp. EKM208P]|nr:ORF6C domain-containing protein [Paenibacillus sp. EKM208P]